MKDRDAELDALLAAPLPAIADDGFTPKIVGRLAARNRLQARLEAILLLFSTALCFVILSLTDAGRILDQALSLGAVPLGLAFAATLLTAALGAGDGRAVR